MGSCLVVATVVVVVVATVVIVVAATVVVVVVDFRVIIFVDIFARYSPALAILNVNAHDSPRPIVNFRGVFIGVNVHEPAFDHVLTPGEFVEAIADRLFT